jgi:hypothetical protein
MRHRAEQRAAIRWDDSADARPARRKCPFRCYYFIDRELGLIHVKVQTWFPMQLQLYVNGHDWARRLDRYARAVNPLPDDLLSCMSYYWVTDQAEYATDIVFTSPQQLRELMPRLLGHQGLHFSAKDVMAFLG